MKEVLHLAIAFDQNYLTPLYVLLTSIFEHENSCKIIAHAITMDVSYEEREKLKNFVNRHQGELFFYEIDNEKLASLKSLNRVNFPPASYFRIFFPLFVPSNVKKLLYLDSDIIAINKLSELYNIELGDFPAGAVPESSKPRPDIGIDQKGVYFNSGVLLINVDIWNEQHISEKVFCLIRENFQKLTWIDQDALNVVLKDNYYSLPTRFNVTDLDTPRDLPRQEFAGFLKGKSLIHFTGIDKPWLTLCKHRFRHLYHYYLKKSPRAFQKKYVDFSLDKHLLTAALLLRIKGFFYNHPQLRNVLRKYKKRIF